MCLLGLGVGIILVDYKNAQVRLYIHVPVHKGRGEYIAMSFMCAGSHKNIFLYLNVSYNLLMSTKYLNIRKIVLLKCEIISVR